MKLKHYIELLHEHRDKHGDDEIVCQLYDGVAVVPAIPRRRTVARDSNGKLRAVDPNKQAGQLVTILNYD